MKEPWEVYFELYREFREKGEPGPGAAWRVGMETLYDLLDRRQKPRAGEIGAALVGVAVAWEEEGGGDWQALRERLRHAWTDVLLRKKRGPGS